MRPSIRVVVLATLGLLGGGCADRGVVSGPASPPGAATWVVVWVAAGLAIVVLGALLARFHEPAVGGASFAAAVLAIHAGAVVVGGAVLAGLAVRSGPFANAKAAGLPGSGTSLLPVSVIDGDPRFFTLMLVLVVLLSGALTFLLAVAARFARRDVPSERFAACAVLGLELVAATYAVARVLQGQRIWPYVLAAANLPILAVALVTCWPRPETRYNGLHG